MNKKRSYVIMKKKNDKFEQILKSIQTKNAKKEKKKLLKKNLKIIVRKNMIYFKNI